MTGTALREGMIVRAKRPSRSKLGTDAIEAGEEGLIEGIGWVWDQPMTETYVSVRLEDKRYIAHPVGQANTLWEFIKWQPTTTPPQPLSTPPQSSAG